MLKGVTPIEQIKVWSNENELFEFCHHIVEHRERYEPERVFEAKSILTRKKDN